MLKNINKRLDWRGWFRDLYATSIKAASGVFVAALTSNVAEHMAPESLKSFTAGAGLNFKQAGAMFLSVLLIEAMRFINLKPLPDAIEEEEQK